MILASGQAAIAAAVPLASWAAIVFGGASDVCAQANFGSLLGELVDRDRLAVHPDGRYEQLQASSYDRRPTPLGAPSSYANADTANFIRATYVHGQQEYVLMEDQGPGVLTRWWMTGSGATDGDVRVYVDGAFAPALSGSMQDLIGDSDHVFGSSLSFQSRPGVDSGHNLYAPIPYSQSVMVVYRGTVNELPGWNPPVYYNINYRKYDPAADVQTYSAADPATYEQEVIAANQALANPAVSGNVTVTHVVTGRSLAAGESLQQHLAGGGAIRRLKVNVSGADQAAALRNTYVELTFDGRRTTRVPLAQFFGNGASGDAQAFNPYRDFYRSVSANGDMSSFWVMPYGSTAEVRLVNRGAAEVVASLEVDAGDWQWNDDSMHFHADYRDDRSIATRGGNGTTDWTMLNVRGRGVYVGDTLSIRNGASGWWGEGDEKVYVDHIDSAGNGSNSQPVHIGTGTEDYYGYAWGHVETFSRPFIAQPISQGNASPGVTVNSRVRALDAIPFDSSMKFDMELWHWQETQADLGGATYWYGAPGAKSLKLTADLAADYRAGLNLTDGAVPDGAGDGQWLYLSSSDRNPLAAGAQSSLLTFGNVGNAGHQGYGGGQNGAHLAAISDEFLFVDGDDNQGIQGRPGYHELALHPAGTIGSGPGADVAERSYVAARWIAGASSVGLANITGSIRNFIGNGDSVDFQVFVDGVEKFVAAGAGATLAESYFDFDVTLSSGSIVDFVLGNGPGENLFGDESLLRAMIYTEYDPASPIQGDVNGDGTITVADWVLVRDNYFADLSALSSQAALARGDLNGDLRNDEYDFALFKQYYDAAHGAGAFAALGRVPEPSALMLVLAAATCFRRRVRCALCDSFRERRVGGRCRAWKSLSAASLFHRSPPPVHGGQS